MDDKKYIPLPDDTLPGQEHREYVASMKNYWDYFSTMTTAIKKGRAEGHAEGLAEGMEKGRAEGRAEGIEKGRAEGRAEGIIEIAKRMKQKGNTTAQIAELTNLSEEEIERLS